MSSVFIDKAPSPLAIIPYYATASLFFLVFSILFLITGSDILAHYFHPQVLAMVHTLALGWITMIILGAVHQLLPVITENHLYSNKLAVLCYVLLTSGTLLLISSFWLFATNWLMILAGSLICLSSFLFFFNVWMTTKDQEHSAIFNTFFLFSSFWFCFTTTVGLLLAINLAYNFIPRNHLEILKLHAHAGLAGWFLQLVTGASAKLIPMFILGKSNKNWMLYAALTFQNVGLALFLARGYNHQIGMDSLAYAVIVGIGIAFWLFYLWDAKKQSLRKKIDFPMQHSFSSFLFLILGLFSLPMVLNQPSGHWISTYGVWIFLGWLSGIILGMTFKTLPFIIWNLKYKDINGMGKIPMPKDLYNQKLLKVQYYLFLSSMLILSLGTIGKIKLLIVIASILWVALASLYLINVAKIIFHKRTVAYGTATH